MHELLAAAGVDFLDWRDHIVTLLAWGEGRSAEREGRPMPRRCADSLAELRFTGTMAIDATVDHIVGLARDEAAANDEEELGPAHLLVALLLEGESVAAATGGWLGMTPGRVRALAGLRNERRVVAGGSPHGPAPTGLRRGPMVLCGGAPDDDLLAKLVALAPRSRRSVPEAVSVDLGWTTRRPSAEERGRLAALLTSAGAHGVDSGLVDRLDASSTEVCERLAEADLIWLGGGDPAAIYDRLWATPALDAIRSASDNGSVVGGVSAGARVWGKGTLSDFASLGDLEPFPLFGWLGDLVIFNHYAPHREGAFRRHLAAFPGCRGLAIAHGGAVRIGAGSNVPEVLQAGVTGTSHVLLAGPDEQLSFVEG